MPTADGLSLSACETMPQRTAADTGAREDLKAAEIAENHSIESTPSVTATELAPEPTPTAAPSNEEDIRVTELRLLGERFREWAERACDCPVMISGETICSFQLTIQGSIHFIKDRGEYIVELERINQWMQRKYEQMHRDNHQVRAGHLQMQRRMKFLERENKSLKVKYDEFERCTVENEITRTIFQEENRNLLEAAAATEGWDLMAIADLRAEDTVAVEADVHATEAKTGHETKSSEHGPSRKRSRLN
ncbi:hypothetical protein F5882DRAFT_517132 [Hyaloscypha sp. PMI_1271]|nr:hypothetical protein F5882DRAFT_517132 [Hyaloscypha sp. PMI_1271]